MAQINSSVFNYIKLVNMLPRIWGKNEHMIKLNSIMQKKLLIIGP